MQKNRVMLVADDIDVNRASFRAMFEGEYEVLEAGDGNETLKILEERKVDIVILDMCMPVKSGKQVLKQMKADPKLLDIPVIVKTVIGEESDHVGRQDHSVHHALILSLCSAKKCSCSGDGRIETITSGVVAFISLMTASRFPTQFSSAYSPARISFGNASCSSALTSLVDNFL